MRVYDFNLDVVNGQKDTCISSHRNSEDGFQPEKPSTGQLYRNLLCGKQIDARTSAPSFLCLEDEMMNWDAGKGGWERSISRKKRKFRWVGPRVSSMATAGHNYIVNELASYSLSCQGVYQSKTVSLNKYVSSLTNKTKQNKKLPEYKLYIAWD